MVDKQKLLDEVMRREKKPKYKKILIYSFLTLVFGGVYSFSEFKNYDRVKFSKELSGVVESIQTSTVSGSENKTVFLIKLENDKTVEIPKIEFAKFQQGDEVKVLRQELESGRMRYSIVLN